MVEQDWIPQGCGFSLSFQPKDNKMERKLVDASVTQQSLINLRDELHRHPRRTSVEQSLLHKVNSCLYGTYPANANIKPCAATERDLEQLRETRKLIQELSWVLDREKDRVQTIPLEYVQNSITKLKEASGLILKELGVDIPSLTG